MNKLKGLLGYIWAFPALFIVLATYVGNSYFSEKLASATGIIVSPWYSGGEIVRTIDHGAYKTYIHRPIFDGLIGEREKGFIQLNWEPFAGLPPVIQERIDYNGDNREDFLVTLNTKTGDASLTAYHTSVLSIEQSYRLKRGWAVRVLLQKRS
ncbi:MAG: hypothetical protein KKH04_01325 [Proteobacteria bacterium]|nr:hypothetical protein [Pseudomonadota bacterium]